MEPLSAKGVLYRSKSILEDEVIVVNEVFTVKEIDAEGGCSNGNISDRLICLAVEMLLPTVDG